MRSTEPTGSWREPWTLLAIWRSLATLAGTSLRLIQIKYIFLLIICIMYVFITIIISLSEVGLPVNILIILFAATLN